MTVFLQENCGIWSSLSNCELRSDCDLNHLSQSRCLMSVYNVCTEYTNAHVIQGSMCWRCFAQKCRNWALRKGDVFSSWMKLTLLIEHRGQHLTCQGVGWEGEWEAEGRWAAEISQLHPFLPGLRGVCVWIERLRRKLRTSAFHQDHIQTASPPRDQHSAAGWKAAAWSLSWWKQIHARRKYIP